MQCRLRYTGSELVQSSFIRLHLRTKKVKTLSWYYHSGNRPTPYNYFHSHPRFAGNFSETNVGTTPLQCLLPGLQLALNRKALPLFSRKIDLSGTQLRREGRAAA